MEMRKICIVGPSAVGKSTFARKLSHKLNIKIIHTDSLMWRPGWQMEKVELINKKLIQVCNEESWILEGYIVKESRDYVFNKADTIIYLNYSKWILVYRYLKRYLKHRNNHRDELKGSPDKFSFKALRTIWNKSELISLNKYLSTVPNHKIIRFNSPKDAERFLSEC